MITTAGVASNKCFHVTRQMTLEEKDPKKSRYTADMPVTSRFKSQELKYSITPGTCRYLLKGVDFPPSTGFSAQSMFLYITDSTRLQLYLGIRYKSL